MNPTHDSTGDVVAIPSHQSATRPLSGLRILCVDDLVDAADSLGTMLDLVGCRTAVSYDAASALAQAESFRPQVCILDITMPQVDGCELARRLRALPNGEELLLIALTALGDYASLERMSDSGFDLHYQKPLPPALLYSVLDDFVEKGRPA